jgi:uncharacterized membrane protein YczE
MKKLESNAALRWTKRLLVYLIGLFCMAVGVVFSARSALGVSPVGSLANVIYQIALDRGQTAVSLGNCTILVYCLYILAELCILRRDFKPEMLLQLVASVLFGWLVNLASAVLSFLPDPLSYPMQMLYLLCSIPLVAVGVMLYLSPNILPTPGEGMSLAISKKTGLSVGGSKTVFDCSMVVISAIVSLGYFRALVGVREGTVICALLVGFVMKRMQRLCQPALLRFVERETKLERAIQAANAGYHVDAAGKPKVVIAIGREFGSGGYEIGRKLAEKLGVTFYDQQINEMAAQDSGLPLEYVNTLEQQMARSVVYDLKTASYALSNEGLPPEEKLFAAQAAVIQRIAAGDESCVIMGHCADYVLYHDPNCFRIFVHAIPDARTARIMTEFGLDREQARTQMVNTDASRARHYKHFTGREYGSQQFYHLAVDSAQLGTDGCVALILESIRLWCAVRGTYPLHTLLKQ